MPKANTGSTEKASLRCKFTGEADEHDCPKKLPTCANCGNDLGCVRCQHQKLIVQCKNCGVTKNLMPWYRNQCKDRKELTGKVGLVRFTGFGFPMIVEGDGILRAVRIDAIPLTRHVTTENGAYLNEAGQPLSPTEWAYVDAE